MFVPQRSRQHEQLSEAVQNHSPHVVVVDELADASEVAAVRSSAQRGVSVIATAHGTQLGDLLKNPPLAPLVGGVKAVTLGDAAAQKRQQKTLAGSSGSAQKTALERAGAPIVHIVVELQRDGIVVHRNAAAAVDAMLRNEPVRVERRWRAADGTVRAVFTHRRASGTALAV